MMCHGDLGGVLPDVSGVRSTSIFRAKQYKRILLEQLAISLNVMPEDRMR